MSDGSYQPDTQQHTLRDRIAAAIQKAHGELHFGLADTWDGKCLRLADAVIAELGLRQERDCSIVRVISDWKTRDD